jgi:DNA-binding LytR/AlgR family response regulator
MESFEFSSIDYLLKPITEDKLKRALAKVKRLEQHFIQNNVLKLINQEETQTLSRIIGKRGTDFVAMSTGDIAYFFTEHKIVFARDFSGRQLIVDMNLGELESQLDKQFFFRINRKYISSINAIERFKPDNGKIQVHLKPEVKEDVHVSKESAASFREWIGGK